MDSQAEDRAYFKSLKINDVTCDFLIDNFIDKETFDDLNKETLRGDLPSAKDGHLIQIKRGIIEKEKAAQLLATVAPADKLDPTPALDNLNAIPAASSASKSPQSSCKPTAGLPTDQQAAAAPGTAISDLANFVSEKRPKSSDKSADVEDNEASRQVDLMPEQGLLVLGKVLLSEQEDDRKTKKRKRENKHGLRKDAAIGGGIGDKLSADNKTSAIPDSTTSDIVDVASDVVVTKHPKSSEKTAADKVGGSAAGCLQALGQKQKIKTSSKKEESLKVNRDKRGSNLVQNQDAARAGRSADKNVKSSQDATASGRQAEKKSNVRVAIKQELREIPHGTADAFAVAFDTAVTAKSLRSKTASKASNGCETSVSKQPHSKGSQSMGKLRSQASAVSDKALHDASVAVAVPMAAKSTNAFRKTAESNDHKSSVKSEAHASASSKASRSHTDRGGSSKPSLSAKKLKTTTEAGSGDACCGALNEPIPSLLGSLRKHVTPKTIQGREYRCVIKNCRTTPRPSMVNADVSFYAAWRSPASFQGTLDFVKRFNGADFKRKDTDTICSHHFKDSDYRSTDGSMFNRYLYRRAVPSLSHTIDRDDGEPDSGIIFITEPISTMKNKAVERLTTSPKSSKASLQDSKRAKTELPSDSSSRSGTRMIPASKKVRPDKSVVKEELESGAETCMMPAAIIKGKTEQSERKYGRAYTAAKGTHPELTKHYYKQTPRGSFLNRDVPCTVLGTREDLATVMGDVNDEVRSNHDGESDDSDDMNE